VRIRSIKPAFWRSDDIDKLDWNSRLVFIGLWSYVDDNGVGRDRLSDIVADLFAGDLSGDPTETLRRVSLAVDVLHRSDLVRRYVAEGKPYLYITSWDSHQLVKNPNKPRFPLPTSDYVVPTESLRTSSVEPPYLLPTVVEEESCSGVEEEGITPQPSADAPTAQTLLGEWIDHCPEPPPGRVKGQIAKEIKSMLDEGIPYERVRQGLATWQQRGLHPSTLPSIVHELATPQMKGRAAEVVGRTERTLARIAAREAGELNLEISP
jgi:hypothetical protein